MKKILIGVFAHPDDEAFCVAATLLKETSEGTELHLICLTDGNGKNSMNPDNVDDLGKARMEEWHAAGKLIGASKHHMLGYTDGKLGNDDHIEIGQKICNLVNEVAKDQTDTSIGFITLGVDGLTGHIDHIVASRSTLLAFYRLKDAGVPVTNVRLACLSVDDFPRTNSDFTLWEPGKSKEEIDETVDMREQAEKVYEIMRAHHSQRSDADFWIQKLGDRVAVNHFIVKS